MKSVSWWSRGFVSWKHGKCSEPAPKGSVPWKSWKCTLVILRFCFQLKIAGGWSLLQLILHFLSSRFPGYREGSCCFKLFDMVSTFLCTLLATIMLGDGPWKKQVGGAEVLFLWQNASFWGLPQGALHFGRLRIWEPERFAFLDGPGQWDCIDFSGFPFFLRMFCSNNFGWAMEM